MAQPARVEPSAAFRKMAKTHYEMFTSFIDAGYDPEQAMDAVNNLLRPVMEKMAAKMAGPGT